MKEFLVQNPSHIPPFEISKGIIDPHSEKPERLLEIEKGLLTHPTAEIIYPTQFVELPRDLLTRVHSPNYIDFLLSLQDTETEAYRYPSVFRYQRSNRLSDLEQVSELGNYSFDMYTPVNKNTPQAALLTATAAYNAALAVLDGDQASYAIGRPPGHHAGYDYMGGYCYINNSALAAEMFSTHGKVAVLDIDYHHGNGTEDIFKRKQYGIKQPRVVTFSIHANPNRKFPYFTGETTTLNAPLWHGVNYALEAGITNNQYRKVLSQALNRIDQLKIDFLVVPTGFDTYKYDKLGDFKLTTAFYGTMGKMIMQLGKPTLFVQEGGYHLASMKNNAISLIRGIESAL